MVILGLLLIGTGAIVILGGVSTSEISDGRLELLGFGISPTVLFVLGVVAGAFVLWGFTILKYGTKREIAQRRENRRLTDLSTKLDRVEAERAREEDQ